MVSPRTLLPLFAIVSLSLIGCGDVALRCSETDCPEGEYCAYEGNDTGRNSHTYDAQCEKIPTACASDQTCECLASENEINNSGIDDDCEVVDGQINVDFAGP